MKQITFADGAIRLNGETLPGLLLSLKIDGKVKYDEQEIDGMSGKSKTPQGWKDHPLVIRLILITDDESDCYEKLGKITPFFKKMDSKANPQIYSIVNRHAQTRGIRKVVFDRLESKEDNKTDEIQVTLGFTEHNPPIVKIEENVAKTPTPSELAEQASDKKEETIPEEDVVITGDLK